MSRIGPSVRAASNPQVLREGLKHGGNTAQHKAAAASRLSLPACQVLIKKGCFSKFFSAIRGINFV